MKTFHGIASASTCLVLLTACGGGGDDGSSPTDAGSGPAAGTTESVQGLYNGTASNGRSITGLVLDDGTYYFLYFSEQTKGGFGGVVQGTGSTSNNKFSSSDMRDFNIEGLQVSPGTVEATFVSGQSISGTLSYQNGGQTTFSGNYDADYETVPTLAAVAGTYNGSVAFSEGEEDAQVTVSSTGAVSGAGDSGCAVSGSLKPHAHGNVYDLSLSFGGAPCLFANQTFNGIAYYKASASMLVAAAPNAARNDGVLFVATKR